MIRDWQTRPKGHHSPSVRKGGVRVLHSGDRLIHRQCLPNFVCTENQHEFAPDIEKRRDAFVSLRFSACTKFYSMPRYDFCTVGSFLRTSALLLMTISPVCRTYPRFAIASAMSAFCSTNRIVTPSLLIC